MELIEEKEDRITALPDPIIQHILSFLPSTKEAIQTSVLSKRWHKQWIHVPALIFDFSGMISEDFSNTSTFIENTLTLHNCSKIDKFHLQFWCSDTNDPQFTSKILFAIRKDVKELYLCPIYMKYILPEFVFNHSSLLKLRADGCIFMPNGKVNLNWGCLTELNLDLCSVTDDVVEHILSGSPSLKSLEISDCYELDKIVIASKSLKRFVIQWPDPSCFRYTVSSIEISCPNLEELSIKDMSIDEPKLFDRVIENVLSGCLLLESFELSNCGKFEKLIVASKSLKRLVLRFVYFINFYVHGCTEKPVIEISCSRLEELKILENLNVEIFKALNLPSSLCATIDFDYDDEQYYETFTDYDVRETQKRLISVLQQLKHVKELRIGGWIIQVLSDSVVQVGGLISPVLNTKCLTLSYPYSNDHYTGLAFMLRNSPLLEKLVIDGPPHNQPCDDDLPKLKDFEENYWNSNSPAVDCLALHLKTIKITFIRKRCKLMLNLLQFLLKNARVLEKLVIVLNPGVLKKLDVILKDHGTCFLEEWLNLPRFSQKTTIELLSYN